MAGDIYKGTPCFECQNKRFIPGDCHISYADPDPEMTGSEHGIRHGWFFYPYNFDPIWRTKSCSNFKREEVKK